MVDKQLSELISYSFPAERIEASSFPPPSSGDLSDYSSAHLLWQAARLTLREGSAPIRSLSRISIRPRVYQFVPLLMALRLDSIRLFIADDVGVGKTIEALLVARELIDRGEIKRLAVLCPPYLCDQWQKELQEKFNLEAVIVRSSTVGQLERHKPVNKSIYEQYPIQVISIDWVKSERNKYQFLQFCPELVIVDEAHGAAESNLRNKGQQQRHQLLTEIAKDGNRHLILLTATPHSGVTTAFRSLLGLLRPEFRDWEIGSLAEPQRIELARHFVQRTRKDIEQNWEGAHCFPQRRSEDATYKLSETYRQLFEETYRFCAELVQTGQKLEERQRRVRYWAALALLRCVMSSPAAAIAALEKRIQETLEFNEDESQFSPFVFEASDELTDDETPTPPIEKAEASLPESDRRRLRALARLASKLSHSPQDSKLIRCVEIVQNLLRDGFHPIVWCRYVATAEYVAEELRKTLDENVQVTAITGRIGDEERRMKVDEIDVHRPRVLVATDCLSEGINLQEKFTAVVHYDLPWNPNRLEQREGRVDRYGQTAPEVKAVRFYGLDNPVDGAVINVLLDKAREIHKELGTYVPVPQESESVMQVVLNSLFLRRRRTDGQLTLFDESEELLQFHRRWDEEKERERVNRTRFAQRAIKPAEVQRELDAVDAVLGDPESVKSFFLNAAQRLGLSIQHDKRHPGIFHVNVSSEARLLLPDAIRIVLPEKKNGFWSISFISPTPEGAEYVGRNHRFVSALARYLLEESLTRGKDAGVSRCGVIRTRAVNILTTLLLLRVRYLIEIPQRAPLLSEEVLVMGYRPLDIVEDRWLDNEEALNLLVEARAEANIPFSEKQELVEAALREIGEWSATRPEWGDGKQIQEGIRTRIFWRARELEESHKRIRKAVSLRVRELKITPQFPPDLLGILILQPEVRG
ncbi:MAG: helicase-related protein [Calditrichia bacterium]